MARGGRHPNPTSYTGPEAEPSSLYAIDSVKHTCLVRPKACSFRKLGDASHIGQFDMPVAVQ